MRIEREAEAKASRTFLRSRSSVDSSQKKYELAREARILVGFPTGRRNVLAALRAEKTFKEILDGAPEAYREMLRYRQSRAIWDNRPRGSVYQPFWHWWAMEHWSGWIIPDDFELRLGYAFVQEPSGNLVSAAAGSNVFAGFALAYNLVRWANPLSGKPPFRGALSVEVSTLFVSDRAAQDVHQRVLVGGGFTFGFPLRYGAADASGERPVNIVELLVRFGAVNEQAPTFANTSSLVDNEVLVQNGFVGLESRWGTGFDAQINVPISEPLGYLILQGAAHQRHRSQSLGCLDHLYDPTRHSHRGPRALSHAIGAGLHQAQARSSE
jgi:hypothetical protein